MLHNVVLRRRCRSLTAAVAFGGLTTWAFAQSAPVAHLVGENFQETLRAEAPVGGDDIVGLAVSGIEGAKGAEKIFVRKPSARGSHICVEMTGRDGRYVASNTYEFPDTAAGSFVLVPTEKTRHADVLRRASVDDFAVVARLGDCPSTGGQVLPVAWGAPPLGNQISRLVAVVQSGRSQARLKVDGIDKPVRCEPIRQSGLKTAFDSECKIDLPAKHSTVIRLQLERCAFEECTLAPATQLGL